MTIYICGQLTLYIFIIKRETRISQIHESKGYIEMTVKRNDMSKGINLRETISERQNKVLKFINIFKLRILSDINKL